MIPQFPQESSAARLGNPPPAAIRNKMNNQQIETHVLSNGLTLVIETMTSVQSATFSILVPGGSVHDPDGQNGTAAILSEVITRGAGERDSKQLSTDLDNLGVQRGESPSCNHLVFRGATLADNLPAALTIYGDVVRRPHLQADQFSAAKSGLEQSLRAMEDEPRQKIMSELKRRCYPQPWGRPTDGTLDDLPNINADAMKSHYERNFHPNGTIIGIAGNVDVNRIKDTIEQIFGDWEVKPASTIETGARGPAVEHINHDSAQLHIALAYDAVPFSSPDYYAAWAAVNVLGGGMSSRLFTEVRERRGLCYNVSAGLNTLPNEGRVVCYAGTSVQRDEKTQQFDVSQAQQTLDVTVQEMVRLEEGIEQAELDRCKARAKSSLIMQQESTIARSRSIAYDWYYLERIRTLSEIRDTIDALTIDSVLDYIRQHPAKDFTVLTIGPHPLKPPEENAL